MGFAIDIRFSSIPPLLFTLQCRICIINLFEDRIKSGKNVELTRRGPEKNKS